jgi:poly(3-hydroxybutyrate) depolymerase
MYVARSIMSEGRALRLVRWLARAAALPVSWRRRIGRHARSLVERSGGWYDDARAQARQWLRSWSRRLAPAHGGTERRLLRGFCTLQRFALPGIRGFRSRLALRLARLRRALPRWIDTQRLRWLPRVEALRGRRFSSGRDQRTRWRHGRVSPNGTASLTWHYGLYTPSGLRDDERAPLVVVLHGCTQRAVRFAHASGWTALADAARVRLLCPEQRRLANQHGCWNWFHSAAQSGQGEVGVITAMIDDVAALVSVDGNAIAAAGVSAGGALSTLLAFHCAHRFRAVIAVAAPTLSGGAALGADALGCAPLAIIHGTADTVVHPRCADNIQERALALLRRAGAYAESRRGAATDGCATVTDFRARGRLLLRRINLEGHGHSWTGGPGGHHYCEPSGPPLTALCHEFLRDVGVLA